MLVKKLSVSTGIFWVEVPEANVFMLCGCPADAVKHLKKRGLVESIDKKIGENIVSYESGPNCILLSEVLMQNGSFSNLIEFPAMQMLYLQGMGIPKHPNNTGIRPMIIGTDEQIEAQMKYFYRGNYGLINKEEYEAVGITGETAEQMMRIKLNFAFGKINPTDAILDKRVIEENDEIDDTKENKKTEIRNGVFIERKGFNIYEISYKDESVEINLNLGAEDRYEAPYQLGYHYLNREYFAVVHSGEGDGWDINRPCMASILIFQGKIYLIDAGPNILTSLNYLGISVNEIEGIFHTHAHDDHFAGLTTLIRTDRRFKYYATPLVRSAVTKKLCALMSIEENNFSNFFDIQDLNFDEWNDVDGLEVMPLYSPHPVETNLFYFRAKWKDTYKTYAHLADVVSFDVFKKMTERTDDLKVSQEWYDKITQNYLIPTDLKKIDIGGGMIHGQAEDYRKDDSKKIVLAHTHKPLTFKEREIGSSAAFGMIDTLIPASRDYLFDFASDYLQFYFPSAPKHEVNYLLNHSVRHFNAGTILFKKGQNSEYVYLLITGSVEFIDSQRGNQHVLPAGSLIGFYSGYLGQKALETYRAASNITVIQIPLQSYHDFVERNDLYSELKRVEKNILFLENTWLFGEVVSFPILTRIAKAMNPIKATDTQLSQKYILYLIEKGTVNIKRNGTRVETLQKGDFFGANEILTAENWEENAGQYSVTLSKDASLFAIAADLIQEIPVVYWKVIETYEKRFRRV
ncbi:metal-dependent hydrolase, beta-lactamase superfamily III [Bernardetia litoralis DSM 6794]|uniref:Metal-dependent hydrolase, beta-lactamase superfamily III n=1 Tax=Bernardetia litoralis (strain ATCC 23117 / DSM 6794 / NBRC 15988 / NCIMB 1366 / Fx l1 / Sio-4) TaxID=880071 RepID=I4AF83_BERLS|nr:cyclic nucleotide-binding domain-containing protein [Bernardetia litoralis]AFM02618.1 metal-dependent hydrolase, beta-lactamase superfamily III [Bernardetia litoralis DSM 6794]